MSERSRRKSRVSLASDGMPSPNSRSQRNSSAPSPPPEVGGRRPTMRDMDMENIFGKTADENEWPEDPIEKAKIFNKTTRKDFKLKSNLLAGPLAFQGGDVDKIVDITRNFLAQTRSSNIVIRRALKRFFRAIRTMNRCIKERARKRDVIINGIVDWWEREEESMRIAYHQKQSTSLNRIHNPITNSIAEFQKTCVPTDVKIEVARLVWREHRIRGAREHRDWRERLLRVEAVLIKTKRDYSVFSRLNEDQRRVLYAARREFTKCAMSSPRSITEHTIVESVTINQLLQIREEIMIQRARVARKAFLEQWEREREDEQAKKREERKKIYLERRRLYVEKRKEQQEDEERLKREAEEEAAKEAARRASLRPRRLSLERGDTLTLPSFGVEANTPTAPTPSAAGSVSPGRSLKLGTSGRWDHLKGSQRRESSLGASVMSGASGSSSPVSKRRSTINDAKKAAAALSGVKWRSREQSQASHEPSPPNSDGPSPIDGVSPRQSVSPPNAAAIALASDYVDATSRPFAPSPPQGGNSPEDAFYRKPPRSDSPEAKEKDAAFRDYYDQLEDELRRKRVEEEERELVHSVRERRKTITTPAIPRFYAIHKEKTKANGVSGAVYEPKDTQVRVRGGPRAGGNANQGESGPQWSYNPRDISDYSKGLKRHTAAYDALTSPAYSIEMLASSTPVVSLSGSSQSRPATTSGGNRPSSRSYTKPITPGNSRGSSPARGARLESPLRRAESPNPHNRSQNSPMRHREAPPSASLSKAGKILLKETSWPAPRVLGNLAEEPLSMSEYISIRPESSKIRPPSNANPIGPDSFDSFKPKPSDKGAVEIKLTDSGAPVTVSDIPQVPTSRPGSASANMSLKSIQAASQRATTPKAAASTTPQQRNLASATKGASSAPAKHRLPVVEPADGPLLYDYNAVRELTERHQRSLVVEAPEYPRASFFNNKVGKSAMEALNTVISSRAGSAAVPAKKGSSAKARPQSNRGPVL